MNLENSHFEYMAVLVAAEQCTMYNVQRAWALTILLLIALCTLTQTHIQTHSTYLCIKYRHIQKVLQSQFTALKQHRNFIHSILHAYTSYVH